jgi:U32 family peptidase
LMTMNKPELLAPVGSFEKLEMALAYGADAVYFGGKAFGLRAFSDNFNDEEMVKALNYVHSKGKKAYVTVNIFPHNEDIDRLPDYLRFLDQAQADAILLSDLGVYRLARDVAPNLPIHISTQANNTNWSSVKMWEELGASRVVLARELSLAEIKGIRSKVHVELETFVHGAMCISYSGRCLLSNYLSGRDSNRGACSQSCRWKYALVEEKRPNEYYPIVEDERGTYLFNSKDLCLLPYLPELMQAGISSLKVEGRMKSVHYVATVIKAYREAIDSYYENPAAFTVKQEWLEELNKVSHRAYTTGFYFNKTRASDQIYGTSSYSQTHDFVGLVLSYDAKRRVALIEQRNNMKVGETIEIAQPGQLPFTQVIESMTNEAGESISVAPHPQQQITMPMKNPVVPYAMLRRRGANHV